MTVSPTGCVYLLCFAETPYKHARHYLGATGMPLADRLAAHRGDGTYGRPARLLRALLAAGGDFQLADVWECADRADAFRLEKLFKHGFQPMRFCSLCEPGNRRGERVIVQAGLTGRVVRWRADVAQLIEVREESTR